MFSVFQVEQDTLRVRIKEVSDLSNDLELQIAEIKGENAASATQAATENKAKEEIMEAKVLVCINQGGFKQLGLD